MQEAAKNFKAKLEEFHNNICCECKYTEERNYSEKSHVETCPFYCTVFCTHYNDIIQTLDRVAQLYVVIDPHRLCVLDGYKIHANTYKIVFGPSTHQACENFINTKRNFNLQIHSVYTDDD